MGGLSVPGPNVAFMKDYAQILEGKCDGGLDKSADFLPYEGITGGQ